VDDSQATVLDTQGGEFESQFTQLDDAIAEDSSQESHQLDTSTKPDTAHIVLPNNASTAISADHLPTLQADEVQWDATQARFIAPQISELAAKVASSMQDTRDGLGIAGNAVAAIPKASPAPMTQALMSSAGQQSESFQPQHPYSAAKPAGTSPAQHRLPYSALFSIASNTPTPQGHTPARAQPPAPPAHRPLLFSDTPSLDTPRSPHVPPESSLSIDSSPTQDTPSPRPASQSGASTPKSDRHGSHGSGSQGSTRKAHAQNMHAVSVRSVEAAGHAFGTLSMQSGSDSQPSALHPVAPSDTHSRPRLQREAVLEHRDQDPNAPWSVCAPTGVDLHGTLSLSPPGLVPPVAAVGGAAGHTVKSPAPLPRDFLGASTPPSPGAASNSTGHTSHATVPYEVAAKQAAPVAQSGSVGGFSYDSDSSQVSAKPQLTKPMLNCGVDGRRGGKAAKLLTPRGPPVNAPTVHDGSPTGRSAASVVQPEKSAQAALLAALARRRNQLRASRQKVSATSDSAAPAGADAGAPVSTPPTQPAATPRKLGQGLQASSEHGNTEHSTPSPKLPTRAQRELMKLASYNGVGESEPPSTDRRTRARRARRPSPPAKANADIPPPSMTKSGKLSTAPVESLTPGSDDDVHILPASAPSSGQSRRLRRRRSSSPAAATPSTHVGQCAAVYRLLTMGVAKWRPTSAMKHVAAWWQADDWRGFQADVAQGDAITARIGQTLLHKLQSVCILPPPPANAPSANWTAMWKWTASVLAVPADRPEALGNLPLAKLLQHSVSGLQWNQVDALLSTCFGSAYVICRQNPFAEWYSGVVVSARTVAENTDKEPTIPLRSLGKVMQEHELLDLSLGITAEIEQTATATRSSAVHETDTGDRVGTPDSILHDVCTWWKKCLPLKADEGGQPRPRGARRRGRAAEQRGRLRDAVTASESGNLPDWWCVCNCLILHVFSAAALWLDDTAGIVTAGRDHWASVGGSRIRVHSWSRMGGKAALPQIVQQSYTQHDTLLSQHASIVDAAKHDARHRLLISVRYEDGDELDQDVTQQEVMFCPRAISTRSSSPTSVQAPAPLAARSPPSRRRNQRKRSRTTFGEYADDGKDCPPQKATATSEIPDVDTGANCSASTAAGGESSVASSAQTSAQSSSHSSPASRLQSALQPASKAPRGGAPSTVSSSLPVAQLDFAALMMAETQSDDGLLSTTDDVPKRTPKLDAAITTPTPGASSLQNADTPVTPVLGDATPLRSSLRSTTPGRAASATSAEGSPRRVRFQGLSSQSQSQPASAGSSAAAVNVASRPQARQATSAGNFPRPSSASPSGRVPGGSAFISPTARRRSVLMATSAAASSLAKDSVAPAKSPSSQAACSTAAISASSRAQAVAAALSGRRRTGSAAAPIKAASTASPAVRLVRPHFARSPQEGPPGSTQEDHPLQRRGPSKPSAALKLLEEEASRS